MHWYLVHTKPRQEKCALQNLGQQGYECYLPVLSIEKLRGSVLAVADEALFPRYLFVRLGQGESAKSWSPIRSTKGVSRLVSFGSIPAKVDDRIVDFLKAQEALHRSPVPMFDQGERVRVAEGAFAGIEGVFQMLDGDRRAMVLIELLSKPVSVGVSLANLRRVS